MSLKELSEKLYPAFIKTFNEFPTEPCRLFLSASNMKTRAIVRHAIGDNPAETWEAALNALKEVLGKKDSVNILRADWVTSSDNITWAQCLRRIKFLQCNEFRRGIFFDKDYKIAFTEQELNANLILYNDEKINGEFQADKAEIYCRQRFNCEFPKMSDADAVEIFDTVGIFIKTGMPEPLTMTGKGANSGRRDLPERGSEFFLQLARTGSNYLANLCNKNGRFTYGFYPCDDKIIPAYSSLYHFSVLSAMADIYSTYGKFGAMALGKAISHGLEYGIKNFIRYKKFSDGQEAAYVNDASQLKLGANAEALLALTKWSLIQHTKKYLPLMKALACGIFSFQKNSGSFVHMLSAEDYSVKEEFRTLYYDGAAVSAVLRLYAITKDETLLESATRAFDYFTNKNWRQEHSQWLAPALNQLTIYKPEKKYFEFGINTCLPRFFALRDLNSPVLLELIMAMENMLRRMQSIPEMSELSAGVDWNSFRITLNRYVEQMLNGHFYPEVAMYFQNPERMLGGFFNRQEAFRARIDDIQFYISGLLAYGKYLDR